MSDRVLFRCARVLLAAASLFVSDAAARQGAPPRYLAEYTVVTEEPERVAVGDMNEDGRVDAIVASRLPGRVFVLLGDGFGALTLHDEHEAGEKPMGLVVDERGLWWPRTKIGAGPVPIETDDGWLMIYHGVLDTCNGFVYHMGAAIVDLDEPWKVTYRCKNILLAPEADYEVFGHVPNVVFPVAALCDQEQDRLAVYYGAADTVTCLCYSRMSELISYIKENSLVF